MIMEANFVWHILYKIVLSGMYGKDYKNENEIFQ